MGATKALLHGRQIRRRMSWTAWLAARRIISVRSQHPLTCTPCCAPSRTWAGAPDLPGPGSAGGGPGRDAGRHRGAAGDEGCVVWYGQHAVQPWLLARALLLPGSAAQPAARPASLQATLPPSHPCYPLLQSNITRAAERTADASVQISRAERSQRSARSKWCFLLVITMIVVGLLMLIILA